MHNTLQTTDEPSFLSLASLQSHQQFQSLTCPDAIASSADQ
jgi:hypothetical protein